MYIPEKNSDTFLRKDLFEISEDGAGNCMLSVALFGAALTHRSDAFGSETLLRGATKIDDILSMLVHYIHC